MRGLPTMTPGFPDPNGANQALHRSDLRSLDSAVQSRVGDGFPVCLSIRSRAEQAQPVWVARLPEHEVRDDCWGLKPTVEDGYAACKASDAGVNEKTSTELANSHGDDRLDLSRP